MWNWITSFEIKVILSSNTFRYNMHTLHWTPYLQLICFQIPNIPLSRLHSYTSTLHAHSKEIPCVLSASMILDLRHRTWTRIIKWIICEYENSHFFFCIFKGFTGYPGKHLLGYSFLNVSLCDALLLNHLQKSRINKLFQVMYHSYQSLQHVLSVTLLCWTRFELGFFIEAA